MTDQVSSPEKPSEYFQGETLKIPFSTNLVVEIRKKTFDLFMSVMECTPDTRILDVGVTSDDSMGANFFEELYPYKNRITCVGVENASHLEKKYPGVKFVRIDPEKPLPFDAGEFDIVFSSAVIEHVGSNAQQTAFLNELMRVGRKFFTTTPNRWFPLDPHTRLPFCHWLPKRMHRALIRKMGFTFFSEEKNLNIIGPGELRSLFAPSAKVIITNVYFVLMPCNLIAYGESK